MLGVDEVNVQVDEVVPPEESETLAGEQDTDKPVAGLADSERATLPAKPPRLFRETVDVALAPDWKLRVAGLADMV